MKKTFTIIVFLTLSMLARGQYVSPGTGATFTLDDLAALSFGVVTSEGNEYYINSNLTILHTDKLLINTDVTVKVAPGVMLTFFGTLQSTPPTQVVFTAINKLIPFRGFRFEGSSASVLRNTTIEYSGGLHLIESHLLIEDCLIRYNTMENASAAISLTNSNATIRYSQFVSNAGSAISSSANGSSSPQILFNRFIHNGTANTNRPQLNLGPGGEDTLRITGNTIEGLYPLVGGIAVSNLLGNSITRALVKGNKIYNNRFGYAQMGNNISSLITGNVITGNNIQNDPRQGGSGLNFFGTMNTNQSIVHNNIIRGNLWGITVQGNALPNLGSASRSRNRVTGGYNIIENNQNSGQVYGVFNNTPNAISAQHNYWGTDDPQMAINYIFGAHNKPDLGAVTFAPMWIPDNRIESFEIDPDLNPHINNLITGHIDHQLNLITLSVPEGTDISSILPTIGSPSYAHILPLADQPMDFSRPVAYTVTPFDGHDRTYLVVINTIQKGLATVSFNISSGGHPITDAEIIFNGQLHKAGTYLFENLQAGNYSFTVEKEGFLPAQGSVAAATDTLRVLIELEPLAAIQNVAHTATLNVFPNPAKDYIEVNHSGRQGNNSVRIFSITGNLLIEIPNIGQGHRIDITNLENGIYLVQLNQGAKTLTRKFSVAR